MRITKKANRFLHAITPDRAKIEFVVPPVKVELDYDHLKEQKKYIIRKRKN